MNNKGIAIMIRLAITLFMAIIIYVALAPILNDIVDSVLPGLDPITAMLFTLIPLTFLLSLISYAFSTRRIEDARGF